MKPSSKSASFAAIAVSTVSALALSAPAQATTNESFSALSYSSGSGVCFINPTISLGATADDDVSAAGIQDAYRVVLSETVASGSTPTSSQIVSDSGNRTATGATVQTVGLSVLPSATLPSGFSLHILDTASASNPLGPVKATRTLSLADLNAAGGACTSLAANNGFSANQAPIADAGSNIALSNYVPGDPIQLNGSGSSDPDGDPLTYTWSNPTGLSGIAFSDPNAVSPTLSVSQAFFGTQSNAQFIINLEVNDGNGNRSSDSIIVSLQRSGNQAPVADAGPDQTVNGYSLGTPAPITGEASTDPDGDPLTYDWRIVSSSVGSPFRSLRDAQTRTPSLVLNTFGSGQQSATVELQLTVDDGNGNTSTDLKTITVNSASANQAPSADAGADQSISSYTNGDTITLNGTGSTDPDGDPLTYQWTQTSGPTVLLSSATAAQPTFSVSNLTTQTAYTFELVVNDGTVSSVADSITIDLTPATVVNQAPTVNAGADVNFGNLNLANPQDIPPTLQLPNPAQVSDPEGDPVTLAWTQTGGASGVTIVNNASGTRPFITLPRGLTGNQTFTLSVVATDSGGAQSAPDTIDITANYNVQNQAPVADAGPDQTVASYVNGGVITLDGTGSSDANGDLLTYSWTQTAGPTVSLSNPTVNQPTFSVANLTAQTAYTFELVVNDGTVSSVADSITVDLTPAPQQLVTAGPNNLTYQSISGECRIAADFSVFGITDDDGNGNDTYEVRLTPAGNPNSRIDFGESNSVLVGSTQNDNLYARIRESTVRIANLSGSSSQLQYTVFDTATGGLTAVGSASIDKTAMTAAGGACADVVAEVDGINRSPIISAGPDISFNNSPLASFGISQATASDPDGDALSVSWTQISGPSVTISNASILNPQISRDPLQDATQQTAVLRLSVSDGVNPSVTDDVTVTLTPNNAPVADAGPDQTLTSFVGDTITLDGSASADINGDALTFAWSQRSGPNVVLSDTAIVQPTFQIPAGLTGTQRLEFSLLVGDGVTNRTDTVVVNLTVNDPPTADAGTDQSISMPTSGQVITLDGSGSSDPEGDSLTYSWTQVSGRSVSLSDRAALSPTFNYSVPSGQLPSREELVFELVVSDANQSSLADQVRVTFVNNSAPQASAGASITGVDAGDVVTLDASASSDPDGDTLSYRWRQISGSAVSLQDANSVRPSFAAPDVQAIETLIFEVEVSDGDLIDMAQVSVEVRPTGSITIVQIAEGGDFGFGFTSTLASLNATIGTLNGSGQIVASRVPTGSYTVTAADVSGFGFALTGLSCSDDDSTADLTNRTASIELAPGENVTCTFTSVNSRAAAQRQIKQFLSVRNTLLLSNGPDVQRRLDRLNGIVQQGSINAAGYVLPNSDKQPISAELDEQGGKVSTSLQTFQAGKSDIDYTGKGSVDVWVEGTFATFDIAGRSGDFSMFYGGFDYLITDDLLIGGLLQIDQIDLDADRSGGGATDGNGYLIGPYVTARLQENLFLDARIAFGQSENSISPLGTFKDEFETDRALFEASVFGDWKLEENTVLRPTISVRHISELQKGYTDSLGVGIGNQTVEQGELSFAPRFQTLWQAGDDFTLRPYAEVEGIYAFGDEPDEVLGNNARLRFEAGTDVFTKESLRGSLSIFADGVGTDAFQSQGLRFQFTYTFE